MRAKSPSPILGVASAMMTEAADTLVGRASRFRHSFEAQVERIRPDPGQPRKSFSEAEIRSLAATMAEQGQLQPILLRPDPDRRDGFIIVAGERRWRAAKLNGWPTILAIRHEGDAEVAALIENLQRVDLTPVEEARGLLRLIEGKGWSQVQAAEALGKSKAEVSATLKILTLPEEVLTSELGIPRNTLVELARIQDPAARARLVQLAREGRLTVKAIRGATREPGEAALPSPAPLSDDPSPDLRVDVRAVERLTSDLRLVRKLGAPPGKRERERLLQLRCEIDDLLGFAE